MMLNSIIIIIMRTAIKFYYSDPNYSSNKHAGGGAIKYTRNPRSEDVPILIT